MNCLSIPLSNRLQTGNFSFQISSPTVGNSTPLEYAKNYLCILNQISIEEKATLMFKRLFRQRNTAINKITSNLEPNNQKPLTKNLKQLLQKSN